MQEVFTPERVTTMYILTAKPHHFVIFLRGKAVWREVIKVTFLNVLVEGAEILEEIS